MNKRIVHLTKVSLKTAKRLKLFVIRTINRQEMFALRQKNFNYLKYA